MVGVHLYLDLLDQLLLHIRLPQLLLVDYLNSKRKPRPDIPGHEHIPKPPLPQFLSQLKLR